MAIQDKTAAHHEDTPLHRAFSLFLVRPGGDVMIQRRAACKKAWPGIWSNSCCGHPRLEEAPEAAVLRRGREELGPLLALEKLEPVTRWTYRFTHQGIAEHEVCHVFVGLASSDCMLQPHPAEISEVRWLPWGEFRQAMVQKPEIFTPWCRESSRFVERTLRQRAWPSFS